MTMTVMTAIVYYAGMFGLDPALVYSVAYNESRLNPYAIGPVGEIGVMQIRPEYTKLSRKALLNSNLNIREGVRKLAEAKKRCKHKKDNTWLVCYNGGITGGSRLKNPKQFPYYRRIMMTYALEKAIGKTVMVEKLYVGGIDGRATLVKKAPAQLNIPHWFIDVDGVVFPVEETRIKEDK